MKRVTLMLAALATAVRCRRSRPGARFPLRLQAPPRLLCPVVRGPIAVVPRVVVPVRVAPRVVYRPVYGYYPYPYCAPARTITTPARPTDSTIRAAGCRWESASMPTLAVGMCNSGKSRSPAVNCWAIVERPYGTNNCTRTCLQRGKKE